MPSTPSISALIRGNNKLTINPYRYDKNEPYQIERINITPEKRDVVRYVDGFLLLIIKHKHYLCIYRPMISASRMLKIGVCIRRYDKNNKTTDPATFRSYEFEHHEEVTRWIKFDRYDSVRIPMLCPANICYATLDITVMKIDTMDNKSIILKEIGERKNGFAFLDVIGGSIRVYKDILSEQIEYFNRLFDKEYMRYTLDVDIEDMIEVIYCLPPFNRPIRGGLTYGALYRLSEKFKCWKLADMADTYINRIRRYTPCLATYIEYEGWIIEAAELRKVTEDENIEPQVHMERRIRRIDRFMWLEDGKGYEKDWSHIPRSADAIVREL